MVGDNYDGKRAYMQVGMKLYTVQKTEGAEFIKNPYAIVIRKEGRYSNHKIEYLGDFLDPKF